MLAWIGLSNGTWASEWSQCKTTTKKLQTTTDVTQLQIHNTDEIMWKWFNTTNKKHEMTTKRPEMTMERHNTTTKTCKTITKRQNNHTETTHFFITSPCMLENWSPHHDAYAYTNDYCYICVLLPQTSIELPDHAVFYFERRNRTSCVTSALLTLVLETSPARLHSSSLQSLTDRDRERKEGGREGEEKTRIIIHNRVGFLWTTESTRYRTRRPDEATTKKIEITVKTTLLLLLLLLRTYNTD